jgi:hypothetical protein
MSKTQPSFRSIADVAKVAEIFSDAAEARVFEPKVERANIVNAVAAE